jgi:hypothetical protein
MSNSEHLKGVGRCLYQYTMPENRLDRFNKTKNISMPDSQRKQASTSELTLRATPLLLTAYN